MINAQMAAKLLTKHPLLFAEELPKMGVQGERQLLGEEVPGWALLLPMPSMARSRPSALLHWPRAPGPDRPHMGTSVDMSA